MPTIPYFITGSYFAEHLDRFLTEKAKKSGSLFFYAEEAGDNPADFFLVWKELLERNPAFHNSGSLIIELNYLHCFKSLEPDESIQKAVTLFAELLKHTFAPGKIWVIQSTIPEYYIMNKNLPRYYTEKKYRNKTTRINLLESYIAELCGGTLCDLTRYYFYEKQPGFQIDCNYYEAECYEDIARKFVLAMGNDIPYDGNPDFSLSIERYIRYQGKTVLHGLPHVFVDMDKVTDRMLIASPPDFAEKYKNSFIHTRSTDQNALVKELLAARTIWRRKNRTVSADSGIAPIFFERLRAFAAVDNGRWKERSVDYQGLFHDEIVSVPILNIVRQFAENTLHLSRKQINTHNCGYYFALMTGLDKKTAMSFVKQDTVIEPILTDVFGSCISRTCLTEEYSGNVLFATNTSWFQTPPYALAQPAVSYPGDLFDNLEEDIHIRNTRLQLEHRVAESIRESQGEWLIVDLQPVLTIHSYKFQDMLFVDFSDTIAGRLGLKYDYPALMARAAGPREPFFQQFIPWMDLIKKKYGDKIILMDCHYSAIISGDDGRLYQPKDPEYEVNYNQFYRDAFSFVRDYLDCYTIELTYDYYADDAGYLSRGYTHYCYQFYQEACQFMKIIRTLPEKKHYCIPGRQKKTFIPGLPMDYSTLHPLPEKLAFRLHEDKIKLLNEKDSLIINSDFRYGRAFWTKWSKQAVLNPEERILTFNENDNTENTQRACWSREARIDADGTVPYVLRMKLRFRDLDADGKFFCIRTFDRPGLIKKTDCLENRVLKVSKYDLKPEADQNVEIVFYPKGQYIKIAPSITRNGYVEYSQITLQRYDSAATEKD